MTSLGLRPNDGRGAARHGGMMAHGSAVSGPARPRAHPGML